MLLEEMTLESVLSCVWEEDGTWGDRLQCLTCSTAWERAASSAQSRDTGMKYCILINQIASQHG